jgi:AraC-like DNA-binding protein
MADFMAWNDTELHNLTALRSLIEGFATSHAASHVAHQEQKAAFLRAILNRLTVAVQDNDYPAFRQADYQLHAAIVALAEVPLLQEAWLVVWNGLQEFHKTGFEELYPDRRVLIVEHEYLIAAVESGDPAAAEEAAHSHVEQHWFRIAEHQGSSAARQSHALQRAAAHLAFRMHRPLRLSDVARKVAFTSPGNLTRLFHRHYGMSFQQYLQKIRLEKAADLLHSTTLPVGRIAHRVGYRDAARFGQHFRRMFQVPPSRWRKQTRS